MHVCMMSPPLFALICFQIVNVHCVESAETLLHNYYQEHMSVQLRIIAQNGVVFTIKGSQR